MEYIVIHTCGLKDITEKVNGLIKKGWKPLGGISLAIDVGAADLYKNEYVQAMIKEKWYGKNNYND